MNRLRQRAMLSVMTLLILWAATTTCLWVQQSRVRAASARPASAIVEAQDPIVAFRTERQQLRARQTAQLNDIIHSDGVDGETAARAQGRLMDLMAREEGELTLEGLLGARGFQDALVSLGTGSATVLVRDSTLNRQQTAIILELVIRETGIGGGNVKIIPIK